MRRLLGFLRSLVAPARCPECGDASIEAIPSLGCWCVNRGCGYRVLA